MANVEGGTKIYVLPSMDKHSVQPPKDGDSHSLLDHSETQWRMEKDAPGSLFEIFKF